jgi:hypothetical protein
VASSPPHVELGHANRGPYAWSPPQPGPLSMVVAPPSQLQAPALAAMGAPMIPPVQAPPIAPPPLPPTIAPRGGPPIPQHPYSLATAPHSSHPYGDWHRHAQHGLPQHGPIPVHAHREINGGPPPMPPQSSGQPLAPPNHLRPPPVASMAHPGPPPPPSQHSPFMAQPPYMNGQPPSPRRLSDGPAYQNGGPYMPGYHGMSHPPPPHSPEYSNAPRMSMLHDTRPLERPMYAPHGSPPLSRDGPPPLNRESNQPPTLNRPASGASASPSLRNLLS